MDYTELYAQSSGHVAFSNGAHWVANAIHDRLVVRRADTFQITRAWQLDLSPSQTQAALTSSTSRPSPIPSSSSESPISGIGWSSDSEYLFATCAKYGVINVFRMRDEEWSARIEAGVEGLTRAEWAPDGRHIICFSDWAVSRLLASHARSRPHKHEFSCGLRYGPW